MKKVSTVRVNGHDFQRAQAHDWSGPRRSLVVLQRLDEAGEILLEQKVATTPDAMKQVFAKIPQSLIAMETGTHSPWVSRLLTEL